MVQEEKELVDTGKEKKQKSKKACDQSQGRKFPWYQIMKESQLFSTVTECALCSRICSLSSEKM